MAPPTNHHHHLLLLAAFSIIVIVSCETVSHLPGFSGELPFNLQTGYINVGDGEMFYYFVESEDNPRVDPLLLWLTGGPGCSSWNGLVYEIGPLEFDLDHSLTYGGLPRLRSYEYSWTKTASIIFLDSPVGTGFSYSTTLEGWPSSDTKAANDAYQFLLKWLEEHPQYLQVPLFLGGDAYSGIVVPLLTKLVAEGNEAGDESYLNLKGYLVGSPNTDEFIDANSKIEFAHRMALISDKNFAALKKSCNGNYINVDPNNTDCILALDTYEMCVSGIWENHILEPKCSLGRPQDDRWTRRSLVEDENEFLLSTPNRLSGLLCRNFNYSLSETWLNNKSVRKALHIREGTVKRWSRCNKTISYTKDQPSVINVHQDLAKYELNVLVTVGDRDMATPFVAVVEWINILKRSLNLTLAEHWRPWFVDAQVGGYTRKFAKKPTYSLTYATVKGGGHTSAEYYRKECYEMFNRWEARGNADDSEWANLYDLEVCGSTDGSPVNDSCGFPPRREMNNEMGNMEEKEDLKNRDGAKVLPFEFIALEACLEAACSSLDHEARTLEQEAHPALDKLTSKISTLNLERVRQIKSRLVALTGRVQKVRDELEHLLDDDDDMAEMYLTEKLAEQMLDDSSVSSVNEHDAMNEGVQPETDDRTAAEMTSEIHGGSARYESDAANAQDHYYGVAATLARSGTRTSTTRSAISKHLDVEELEMLLEAYFVQIDGTLNKLTTLREYVDDTEDYINIMLDDKQNHLLQMGVMLTTATLVVSAFVVVAGVFGMNITIDLFDDKKSGDPEFLWTVGGGATGTIVLYFLAIAWCKHKRLL